MSPMDGPVADTPPYLAHPEPPKPARPATQFQRLALLGGLLVTFYLALNLFASILLPFVAAAGMRAGLD